MDNLYKHFKCPKHENFDIQLLKVNNVSLEDSKNIFYCCNCSDEDESFQQKDFILTHKIIDQGATQILPKWPPLSNSKLLENLISELKESQSQNNMIDQINEFFDFFQKELIAKIEICRKSLIRITAELNLQNNSTLEKYQEISKILDLRNILINETTNVQQKEANCKELILELEKLKSQNTSEVLNILSEHILLRNQINFSALDQLKKQIFKLVDKIQYSNSSEEHNMQPQNINPQIEMHSELRIQNGNDRIQAGYIPLITTISNSQFSRWKLKTSSNFN